MKYALFKTLSQFNKAVLPKIYKKPDLAKLNKVDLAIAGWKRWVTFNYMDARDERVREAN